MSGAIGRGAIRGVQSGGSRLRNMIRSGDSPSGSGSSPSGSSGDSGLRETASWWGTRGGAVAGAGAGIGLAYRQQNIWSDEADAREREAQAELYDGLPEEIQEMLAAAEGEGDGDGESILDQIRDALPGVETVQQTIIVLVVLALVLHFAMNQSNQLPNSPVVVAGGDR